MPTSSENTLQPRIRVYAFDALRVIAILAVLLIHALLTGRRFGHTPALSALDDAVHFAVPVFVFVSGALLWSRPWHKGTFHTFVKKRFARIGPSYLLWSSLYIMLIFVGISGLVAKPLGLHITQLGFESSGLLHYVSRAFVYLLTGESWYHLYFIPMIFVFYLLTPLASRALRRFKGSAELLVLATLCLKVLVWPPLSSMLASWGSFTIDAFLAHLFQHLPNMALGGWFALRFDDALKAYSARWQQGARRAANDPAAQDSAPRSMAALAGLSLRPLKLGLSSFGDIALIALPAFLLEPFWVKIRKPLAHASRLSFGVYYIHPLFLLAVQRITMAHLTHDRWVEFWTSTGGVALTWLILIIGSYAACLLIDRVQKLRWIIGA